MQLSHLYAKAAVESYGTHDLEGRYQAALRAVAAVEVELAGTTEGEQAQLQSLLHISEDRLGEQSTSHEMNSKTNICTYRCS
jgi:hypothetical protein